MIYPIIAYGDPVLRKKCEEITKNYPNLKQLIADMYETMYNASGVGLAAPQIGLPVRLFITDGAAFESDEMQNFQKVFINPVITGEEGNDWNYNEGCLSIPEIREDVSRPFRVHIKYHDEDFNLKNETYEELAARIIQHEYDHLEGILFTDHLSALRKRLLKGRLTDISKGLVDVKYKMKFPLRK